LQQEKYVVTIFGREIAGRIIGMVVGVIVLIVVVSLFVKSCDNRRDRAAQSRVDAAQGEAKDESSADAINTVSRAGEAQAESEALSRANERDIRAAEGAGERVGAGVNTAGRRALCKREAFKNDPKCAIFRSER
jgi:mannitol-specific phosphotransferase system IIBC component